MTRGHTDTFQGLSLVFRCCRGNVRRRSQSDEITEWPRVSQDFPREYSYWLLPGIQFVAASNRGLNNTRSVLISQMRMIFRELIADNVIAVLSELRRLSLRS